MNDFETYPALMWMLTVAEVGTAAVAALIPLAAALMPEEHTEEGS